MDTNNMYGFEEKRAQIEANYQQSVERFEAIAEQNQLEHENYMRFIFIVGIVILAFRVIMFLLVMSKKKTVRRMATQASVVQDPTDDILWNMYRYQKQEDERLFMEQCQRDMEQAEQMNMNNISMMQDSFQQMNWDMSMNSNMFGGGYNI